MLTVPSRFEMVLQRDLAATEVELVGPGAQATFEKDGGRTVSAEIARGHRVVVGLAEWPADVGVVAQRLQLLVESFRDLLEAAIGAGTRPAPAEMLHRELRALASAAAAVDALVIDAQSDVVWSAAQSDDFEPHVVHEPAEVISLDGTRRIDPPPPSLSVSEQAIVLVRALPAMAGVARGTPLAHHDRGGALPYLARSFATIYVLVLVFAEPFDEVRAEREVQARLEVVERLVLALPPIDPTPTRDAKAVRQQG